MTKKTNANRCILAKSCTLVDGPKCRDTCASYIAMHSKSGRHTLANIPQEYAFVTAENAPCRDEQEKAYKMVNAYIKTFTRQFDEESDRIKSLYLYSEATGTGKTTTAAALVNEWLRVHYIGSIQRNRQALNRPGYFMDANGFHTLYNSFNRSNVPREVAEEYAKRYYRILDIAKTVPLLVVDDIGVRDDMTKPFIADMFDVINGRIGLPTIYTSNVALAELADIFDQYGRLYDRIRDNTIEIEFVGQSKRGVRK